MYFFYWNRGNRLIHPLQCDGLWFLRSWAFQLQGMYLQVSFGINIVIPRATPATIWKIASGQRRPNLYGGKSRIIKRVLLAEAQHRRLRSSFGWGRPNCLVLMMVLSPYLNTCRNVYRQEEKEEDDEQARTGEDLCHPSAYNRRVRATQSPNDCIG